MMCPEAKAKLQEVFRWWKDHVEHHSCIGCSIARVALTSQSTVMQLLKKEGVNV